MWVANFVSWKSWLYRVPVQVLVLACSFKWKFEQCADTVVSIPYEFNRHSIKLKVARWFQTAGFGVFAGRAFKLDEIVLPSWKTLFLPGNFPTRQALCNYAFGYNATHVALVLDYGSVLNHHESANVEVGEEYPGGGVHFYVRMDFQCGNRNAPKICCINACMHTYRYTIETRIHQNFQGHKRHRSWTGNFGSVWQCEVVWN